MSKFNLFNGNMGDPEEILSRGLPKWPQMKVKGETIPVDAANEIIRRTDTFFLGWGGNNKRWNKWAWEMLKVPNHDSDIFDNYDLFCEAKESFKKTWELIETEYVANSWMSSSFIGGPHGWCHPTGRIFYSDNVGKWPSCEDIFNEWKILAGAFPFLKLGVVLMNGESCEDGTSPVCGFIVRNGTVTVVDPKIIDPLFEFEKDEKHQTENRLDEKSLFYRFSNPRAEQGIDDRVIINWALKFWGEEHVRSVQTPTL